MHNTLFRIAKSFINFRSTHWRHQSTIFLLNSINIISKNPWVKYLCISLNLPPPAYAFCSPNLAKILDPWTSVDMVPPVEVSLSLMKVLSSRIPAYCLVDPDPCGFDIYERFSQKIYDHFLAITDTVLCAYSTIS